mgnify:CR=1 FL=1
MVLPVHSSRRTARSRPGNRKPPLPPAWPVWYDKRAQKQICLAIHFMQCQVILSFLLTESAKGSNI